MKCILCGAGAESSFGLSDGANFALGVLGINQKEMDNALNDFYRSKNYSWCSNRPNKNPFKIDSLFEAAYRKKYINGEISVETMNKMDSEIKKCKETYTDEQKNKIINESTSYMGIIDEHFHTIINPKALGPEKFWRVVDCYTRAYLLLVSEILYPKMSMSMSSNDYLKILENPDSTLKKINTAIMNEERFHGDSYYSRLSKYNNIKIVTTNYTPCCSIITGKEDEVVYIHGKIGLFEVPYEWKIYEAAQIQEYIDSKLFFPYLFIQSGIKPIVEERQIKEYYKMIKAFEAEKIIILGYRINCDDNHINGMLRSAYEQGKEIVYLDYPSSDGIHSTKETIAKRLRIEEPTSNLRFVPIENTDCLDKLENELI